jgi:carbamoyl-phosphate synthase large subunit
MKNNNILLLSAGRRVELAIAFQTEIKNRNLDSKLLATDLNPHLSAACQVVDIAICAPRVTDLGYIDFLLSICKEHSIGLVVPTIDTELLILAKHRELFAKEGIDLIISDEILVGICRDKRLTANLFNELKIDTPEIYDRHSLRFPCFAKPYDGSCSIGATKIQNLDMLSESVLADEKMMFMELISDSYVEFTVDAYFSKYGKLISFVPRQRIEVRGGEISKGITKKHALYDYLLPKLQLIQGARGCLALQLFVSPNIDRIAALEINPRFGGGYPLSYSAGANYPGWLIDEYLLNKDLSYFDNWEANLMMLRYDAKVLVHDAK